MAGIYIHIPFCKKRCSYCDFYKDTNISIKSDFIESLKREFSFRASFFKSNTVITTLYFGGGTPSVLNLDEFKEIILELNRIFDLSKIEELTVELNPDDVSLEYLSGLKNLGVNRVSFGVQSFHDKYLKMIRRRHDSHQALEAVSLCKLVGIDNISIDLIYGLPGLTLEEWQNDIDLFLSLKVPHLSAYHLIYEEGTLMTAQLKKGLFSEATEEESSDQFNLLRNGLINHGFEHYEISNFSLPNMYSKHNSSYWKGELYLGFGPSAHSFDGRVRYWNFSDLNKYISFLNQGRDDFFDCEELSEKDIYNELVMLGLRTKKGIYEGDLKSKVSLDFQHYFDKIIKDKMKNGEIVLKDHHYSISKDLFLISNKIISDIFFVD